MAENPANLLLEKQPMSSSMHARAHACAYVVSRPACNIALRMTARYCVSHITYGSMPAWPYAHAPACTCLQLPAC